MGGGGEGVDLMSEFVEFGVEGGEVGCDDELDVGVLRGAPNPIDCFGSSARILNPCLIGRPMFQPFLCPLCSRKTGRMRER